MVDCMRATIFGINLIISLLYPVKVIAYFHQASVDIRVPP